MENLQKLFKRSEDTPKPSEQEKRPKQQTNRSAVVSQFDAQVGEEIELVEITEGGCGRNTATNQVVQRAQKPPQSPNNFVNIIF